MGALSNYYVDPAGGNDTTGDGTIGTPWATVQKALNTITRDSTNGDRINIKAGSDDVLTAVLSLTTYGTPTGAAPLMFEGYTSTQGDGGIGGLSQGGANRSILASGNSIIFKNMHLHSTGTSTIINNTAGDRFRFINCELDNTSGNGITTRDYLLVLNCHFHNIGGRAVSITGFTHILNSYFKNDGSNNFVNAIFNSAITDDVLIANNIFSLSSTSNAFNSQYEHFRLMNNSFFTTGTGTAITSSNASTNEGGSCVIDNLFEGWGTGIDVSADTDGSTSPIRGNAAFNCSTAYSLGDAVFTYDNETLGSTPFAKSGADSFSNRATYYAPQDVGNVLSTEFGIFKAKGAVQI